MSPKQKAVAYLTEYLKACPDNEQIIDEKWLAAIQKDYNLTEGDLSDTTWIHLCVLLPDKIVNQFITGQSPTLKLSDLLIEAQKTGLDREYAALQVKAIAEVKKELQRIGRILDSDVDLICMPLPASQFNDTWWRLYPNGQFDLYHMKTDLSEWFKEGGTMNDLITIHRNLIEL